MHGETKILIEIRHMIVGGDGSELLRGCVSKLWIYKGGHSLNARGCSLLSERGTHLLASHFSSVLC